MLKWFAMSQRRGRSLSSVRPILLGLLLAPALCACVTPTVAPTPPDALRRKCLIPVTGRPEVDAPALELALEKCDAQNVAWGVYVDGLRGR